jgi:hypothetical protein
MTRMEKRTSGAAKLSQRCAHVREQIRDGLSKVIGAAMAKGIRTGKPVPDMRVDSIYAGADMVSVVGTEAVARLAADLFRKGGLRNVEVYENLATPGVWVAAGLTT